MFIAHFVDSNKTGLAATSSIQTASGRSGLSMDMLEQEDSLLFSIPMKQAELTEPGWGA